MSSYIEYNGTIAFHPSYYIKEIIDSMGITQEDFAKRLGTTPKNLSILLKGEQELSLELAMRLSRMLDTSIDYWLNLQRKYDALVAEFKSEEELHREREVFKLIEYKYFREHFKLPDLPRKIDEQIAQVRALLKVSSLCVLLKEDLAVNYRSYTSLLSESNIVNANIMVQLAINRAIEIDAPKYDKKLFLESVEYALTLTSHHDEFLPLLQERFRESGVILVVLPNLKNSGINGATKKIGNKILLMVNDRRGYADTFWFSLFHEIGHILNNDYGISFDGHNDEAEELADVYAQNALIPQEKYSAFIRKNCSFNETIILEFAKEISRDPGIVLGRLQKDKIVPYSNKALSEKLKTKYNVCLRIDV